MKTGTCRDSAEIRRRIAENVRESAVAAERLRAIGQPVIVTEDNGTETHTHLTSLPWQLGHGAWVAKVRGKSGGYACERIRPA